MVSYSFSNFIILFVITKNLISNEKISKIRAIFNRRKRHFRQRIIWQSLPRIRSHELYVGGYKGNRLGLPLKIWRLNENNHLYMVINIGN